MDEGIAYLQDGVNIVTDPADIIPAHTLYIRTALNLRDGEGRLLAAFGEKGAVVQVTGCDYLLENGQVHMYRVNLDGTEGYIPPWYLASTQEAALENYDDGD